MIKRVTDEASHTSAVNDRVRLDRSLVCLDRTQSRHSIVIDVGL